LGLELVLACAYCSAKLVSRDGIRNTQYLMAALPHTLNKSSMLVMVSLQVMRGRVRGAVVKFV
jgi:hypothetical protein